MKRNSVQHSKPGFTLTELLVVIVIVITIAAVVFFATNGIRNKAHTALALSNLRQLSVAAHSAANEKVGRLPCTIWKSESRGIGFVETCAGTLTLSGATNTYAGDTTIKAGTLALGLSGTFGTIINPLSATLHQKLVTGGGDLSLITISFHRPCTSPFDPS